MPTKRKANGSGRFVIKPEIKSHETVTLNIPKEEWDALRRYGLIALKGSSPEHVCTSVISLFIERDVLPALAKADQPAEPKESKPGKPKAVKPLQTEAVA
jgi:hypothetical protein